MSGTCQLQVDNDVSFSQPTDLHNGEHTLTMTQGHTRVNGHAQPSRMQDSRSHQDLDSTAVNAYVSQGGPVGNAHARAENGTAPPYARGAYQGFNLVIQNQLRQENPEFYNKSLNISNSLNGSKKMKKKSKYGNLNRSQNMQRDLTNTMGSNTSETPCRLGVQRIGVRPDVVDMIEKMPVEEQILAQRMLADNLNKKADTSNENMGSKSSPFYSAKGGASDEQGLVRKISDLSMSSSNKFRTAENRSTLQTPARSALSRSKLSANDQRNSHSVTPKTKKSLKMSGTNKGSSSMLKSRSQSHKRKKLADNNMPSTKAKQAAKP
jgi:hypothetical protein